MNYLGDYKDNSTIYIPFNTNDADGASCTVTDLANTDVHIHKDGGLTQRNNAAGVTVSINYDGITGNHLISIDTSDETVAGFYAVGHDYDVRLEGITVDGQTLNVWIAKFSIENRTAILTSSQPLYTPAIAGDNMIASTVLDKGGYSLVITPPTAGQIRTEMETGTSALLPLIKAKTDTSAQTGGDSDTLETLSDQIDAISAAAGTPSIGD